MAADIVYVKAEGGESWHVLMTWTRVPQMALALCGRRQEKAEDRDTLPAEKTCESCFRILATRTQKEDDPATPHEDPVV